MYNTDQQHIYGQRRLQSASYAVLSMYTKKESSQTHNVSSFGLKPGKALGW